MQSWDIQVPYSLNMPYTKQATVILILFALSIQYGISQEVEEDLYERTILESEGNMRDQNESEGFIHRQRININQATPQDLVKLGVLTPEQIRQFMIFRTTFGNFISLAELQSIPYWDLATIRQVLAFVYIDNPGQLFSSIKKITNNSEHTILYRTGGKIIDSLVDNAEREQQSIQKAKNTYPQLISYRFNSSDRILWGLTIEKDAGEKNMVDYSSGYLMMKNKGIVNKVIVGDYVVNIAQGMIHWQGHAFGRSSNIIQGFKQSELFKAHTGTDENIFHRGAAISLSKYQIELSTFISALRIDANIITDPVSGGRTASSLLTSGLHRSESELEDKDAMRQSAVGGRLAWNTLKGKIGLNHTRFNYDIPISKRSLPYNRYAVSGDSWHNTSVDCSWSSSFGLVFGEVAMDKRSATAIIAGVIKSFDPKFDLSIIIRNMSENYKAIQSNTMTQQGEAGNEKGIFTCFNFVPTPKIKIEGFADHYTNSWPVYFNDGIRRGESYAIQYLFRPDKKNEIYVRLRGSRQTSNMDIEESRTNHLSSIHSQSIRIHLSSQIGEVFTIRYRAEILRLKNEYKRDEKGILSFAEFIIKPRRSVISISGRYTFFDTESYSSRIYAYERDILSYHAVPAHYDNGTRAYLVMQYKLNKAVHVSAKCVLSNREKNHPPYYDSAYSRVKQVDWRIQLLWKIRS